MLEILRIKNFAIIDETEISFGKGLNILSGETGTGKSIIIEAIGLLLGSRASAEIIRSQCDEAVIEGLFSLESLPWMKRRLQSLGFEDEATELLVKRSVHRSGKHRISINGELATLSTLQHICEGLIDLCGQHEHQSLLQSSKQLELLDRFGGSVHDAEEWSHLCSSLRAAQKEKLQMEQAEIERARRLDFLNFQIQEISDAHLQPGEDLELQAEKQRLQTAQARLRMAQAAHEAVESDEGGILHLFQKVVQRLRTLREMDGDASTVLETFETSLIQVEEAVDALSKYLGTIEIDPERLEMIQERLSLLVDLKRKYGSSVEEILETFSELKKELESLETIEQESARLSSLIEHWEKELATLGKRLMAARKKAAEEFCELVTQELKDLKLEHARFQIEFLKTEPSPGLGCIQYLVRTNPGEPAKPLSKIASGGELSRLMLSIRRVIADRGGIGVYLFDEIDSGMGGQTAFEVGRKLRSVARFNQVICITHLPQVASFADVHWAVRKVVSRSKTTTRLELLDVDARKRELARMLGGPQLTQRSMENAVELMELAVQGSLSR